MDTLGEVFDAFREASTKRTKERYADMPLPIARRGKEFYQFTVGQTVTTTGAGPMVAGCKVIISQRMKNNGYCQYFASGLWHKQGDLAADLAED